MEHKDIYVICIKRETIEEQTELFTYLRKKYGDRIEILEGQDFNKISEDYSD